MKAAISVLIQDGPPAPTKDRESRIAHLRKQVEYACECIEYDHHKEAALRFLQELHRKLSQHQFLRDDTQALIERIYQIIRDYGILPLEPKE